MGTVSARPPFLPTGYDKKRALRLPLPSSFRPPPSSSSSSSSTTVAMVVVVVAARKPDQRRASSSNRVRLSSFRAGLQAHKPR